MHAHIYGKKMRYILWHSLGMIIVFLRTCMKLHYEVLIYHCNALRRIPRIKRPQHAVYSRQMHHWPSSTGRVNCYLENEALATNYCNIGT